MRKSLSNRLEKIEDRTLNTKEDAPDNLKDLYAKEDNPESDMAKELDALYDPEHKPK